MLAACLAHLGNVKMCARVHVCVHVCMFVSTCVCVCVCVFPSPTLRNSDSVGLECILRICIFLKSSQVILMQSAIPKAVCKCVLQEIRDHGTGLLASSTGQVAQFVAGHCDSYQP